MSHQIEYYTYKENVNQTDVLNKLNNYVSHVTWQEGGSDIGGIRWINVVCKSYDEAKDYIEKHDKGWYDQLAVKYRTCKAPTTKAYITAKQAIQDTWNKLNALERTVVYTPQTVKSAYVGCKKCGSKLSVQYIKTNYCPLCHNDLRSQTTLNKIASLKKKHEELQKKVKDMEIKNSAKAPINWLVKIEYHT